MVKLDILADFGEEYGDFRHQLVIHGAQFRCIGHGVEVRYHAPDAADALGDVGEFFHGIDPSGFALSLNVGNAGSGFGEGGFEGRADVGGLDLVETRLFAELEQGIHGLSFG